MGGDAKREEGGKKLHREGTEEDEQRTQNRQMRWIMCGVNVRIKKVTTLSNDVSCRCVYPGLGVVAPGGGCRVRKQDEINLLLIYGLIPHCVRHQRSVPSVQ